MSHDATNWAIKQRGLKPAAKIVLWHLCDRFHPDNGCFPSQDTLAADCEMSRSSVNEHLAALEEARLIRREQRRDGPTNRQKSTRYRFAFEGEFDEPKAAENMETPSPESGHGSGSGAVSGNRPEPCPENAESRVQNPDTNPVREPLREPIERERGREADPEESKPEAAAERHGSAEFEKRVMRFCNGTGYLAGPWRDWDSASPSWIGRQFAALSIEERAEAERWRDGYLLDHTDRKTKPMPVGVFLRDCAWRGLDAALLDRADKLRAARLKPEERAKPDGWAASMGPVGMAKLFSYLMAGPADATMAARVAERVFVSDAILRQAWPDVWNWQALLRQKGGVIFGPRWHALKDVMEPVPKGSEVLAAWRQAFTDRAWPWLAAFDQAAVVYCPKGGPAGLEAFQEALSGEAAKRDEKQERALRGETEEQKGNHDDAGGHQAAE